jgi:RimJ/RimL family protein N-acetyltransferase
MDGVREGFIQQEIISRKKHEKYMKKNSDFFWICLIENIPAGYIGVIEDDIRIATHPDYQGLGVATYMLNQIMRINPKAFAKVKINNKASLRLFEKCGFKKEYYLLEKKN